MPDRNGFQTLDVIATTLGYSEHRVRNAINVLGIQPVFFPDNRRMRFYRPADITLIQRFLRGELKVRIEPEEPPALPSS